MKRYLLFLMSCVLCIGLGWAQTDDFDPDTPGEPGDRDGAWIELSVSPQGAGTVSGAGQYNVGQSVRISTSCAGAQWRFLRWRNAKTNAVVSTSSGFYMTATKGTTQLVAEYEELPLTTLTLQCEPSEVGAYLSGGGTYVEGSSVYVWANSVSNWTFEKWTNKRTGATVSNNYSFNFTKTASPDTLIANYTYNPSTPGEPEKPVEPTPPVVYRTLSVQSNDTEMGYTSITSQQVKVGDQVSVSAYNRENYAFVGWERDGAVVSTNPTYTLTMPNRNVSLTAIFEFAPATPGDPDMAEEQPQDNPDDPDDPDDPDTPDNPDEPVEPVEPSTLPGDVNGDYRVNILDLTLINGYILGIRPEKFIFANADLNQDGRISVVDATLLIALILLQH